MDGFVVFWTARQIADRDGVSRQAVSRIFKNLLDARPDTPVERDARGRIDRVSLAHYDEFRQRHVNPAKATAPIRRADDAGMRTRSEKLPAGTDSFEEARRQSEWLKVAREKIRHQEECGELVRKDRLEETVALIGPELQAILKRLPNRADDVALAVSKEGVHGVRVLLRQIAFEIGNQMADRLEAIADAAPESDPLIDEDEDDGQ